MITYDKGLFGINLLLRVNGSGIYRATLPGFLSVIVLIISRLVWGISQRDDNIQELRHPYTVGVLVASTTFLLVFRLQQAYSRYWEASSTVHQMMSKWMDATIHTACFHMQCIHYNHIKPPSFIHYTQLDHMYLTRDRERLILRRRPTKSASASASASASCGGQYYYHPDTNNDDDGNYLYEEGAANDQLDESLRIVDRARSKSIEYVSSQRTRRLKPSSSSQRNVHHHHHHKDNKNHNHNNNNNYAGGASVGNNGHDHSSNSSTVGGTTTLLPPPTPLEGPGRFDGNWSSYYTDPNHVDMDDMGHNMHSKSTYINTKQPNVKDTRGFASYQGGCTPPLFLQELSHLASLMAGVALSTLRNDIEGAECPLDIYIPGSTWPVLDPDLHQTELKYENGTATSSKTLKRILDYLGAGRTPEERTRYNATRPLQILGGVSEAEIKHLQMARGQYAKTQLVWMWFSEFITREHLEGSLGKVGPPIVSRIIQFLSDGMVFYNHARKVANIPFPFPHAQLAVFYVFTAIPAVAILMDQYTADLWFGCVLTFLTVTCLAGIHEVARELENPFRNIPNELPIVTWHAQFNEALITMYAGYHPDFYWNHAGDDFLVARRRRTQQQQQQQKEEENENEKENEKQQYNNNNNKTKKNNDNSSSGGSGDVGVSEKVETTKTKTATTAPATATAVQQPSSIVPSAPATTTTTTTVAAERRPTDKVDNRKRLLDDDFSSSSSSSSHLKMKTTTSSEQQQQSQQQPQTQNIDELMKFLIQRNDELSNEVAQLRAAVAGRNDGSSSSSSSNGPVSINNGNHVVTNNNSNNGEEKKSNDHQHQAMLNGESNNNHIDDLLLGPQPSSSSTTTTPTTKTTQDKNTIGGDDKQTTTIESSSSPATTPMSIAG